MKNTGRYVQTKRILGINKETGQPVPLIEGSHVTALSAEYCPWKYAELELNFTGPYENPDLICPNLVIGMCQADGPVNGEFRLNGKVYHATFTDQAVSLIPPGDVGRWVLHDPHGSLLVSINRSLLVDIAVDAGLSGDNQLPLLTPFEDQFVKGSMIALREEAESGYCAGQLYGDAIATALIAHLLSRYRLSKDKLSEPKGGLSKQALQAVTNSLEENYNRDISLAELSALAHLSPYHFSRLFKHSTGMSPHQYLIHLRVMKAKELLKDGRMNFKQIASEVGFWDASHLSRHFKRIYGVSLSELNDRSKPQNMARQLR